MSSSNDIQRSLSTQIEESINANARSLFKRYQSPLNNPDPPKKPDRGETQDEFIPNPEINEIDISDQDNPLNVSDIPGDGLRLRTIKGGASNLDSVSGEEGDKILNANINKNESIKDTEKPIKSAPKGKDNVLNCFAEYKAEKEEVEMSQEFFVNSIKELVTGKLGYVSQSIYADARRHKQEEWKEYEKAPIISKVFNHPGMTINTVRESVIRNTQKYSIRFLWRWVPHRELQFLILLYFYSLILLPDVLFTVVPTILSVCIFLTMLVYSLQIISARLDFSEYLSIIDSLGIVDDIYKNVIASDYLRKTSVIYYLKFFSCWFLFLFIFPQVQTQIPSFFVPLSLFFFVTSIYHALQVREKVVYLSILIWFFEFFTWLIFMLVGPFTLLLIAGTAIKMAHAIVFVYMAWCYKWKGFTLLLCPHFFMAVWWKMFALSVLNIQISQLIYIIFGTVIVIAFLPFLTILIVFLLAISPMAVWYYYDLNAALVVWGGLLTAGVGVLLFGWFYDRLLKLNIVQLTFKNAMWLGFLLFSVVCFISYAYSQYQFNQMPVIAFKDYSEFCSPRGGDQNFANFQHRCLHLVGRKVRLEGVVDNIYLESRENSLERVINKIPIGPLVQGLTCLLGNKMSSAEDCDLDKYGDLCQVGHCSMSLGEEFTYSIELGGRARMYSNTAKISAGTKFKDDLLKLKKFDKIDILGRVEEVGATSSKIKLLSIKSDNGRDELSSFLLITNYLKSVVYFFLL